MLERINREKAFFENIYSNQNNELINLQIDPEAKVSFWFDDAIRYMGNLQDKLVLDLGCGTGVTSIYMALRGAEVIAVDISEEALKICKLRAEANEVDKRVHIYNSAIELLNTDLIGNNIDIVHGCAILHHLDLNFAIPAIKSLMKPGSRAYFSETSYLNPIFRFLRERISGHFGIPSYRTQDEKPLDRNSLALLREYFNQVQILRSYRFLAQASGYIPMNDKISGLLCKIDDYLLVRRPLKLSGYWILMECSV
jgi:2-polyprenyl-3-methyl-5-hydroxy-6-metoxy-1,4-benzoquinol methylase